MKKFSFVIALLFGCFIGQVFAQETTWHFDKEHSKIQFKSVYMGIANVYGEFREYYGTINTNKKQFENARINVNIKSKSISTGIEMRDDHLKSEDFLYAEKYPEIKFECNSLTKVNDSIFKMDGNLTIRGITKKETFDVKYKGMVQKDDENRSAFTIIGTINRFDYNVDWNEKFLRGFVVSKDLDIICDVLLVDDKK